MLGKLLKYEWKSSGKITLLLNAYIILITIFGMIMLQSGFFDELIEGSQAAHNRFPADQRLFHKYDSCCNRCYTVSGFPVL